jgi:hypothetical protein
VLVVLAENLSAFACAIPWPYATGSQTSTMYRNRLARKVKENALFARYSTERG